MYWVALFGTSARRGVGGSLRQMTHTSLGNYIGIEFEYSDYTVNALID